jgi:hypothetical protein
MSFTWSELKKLQPDEEWRLPLPPTCPQCAYNLTGLTENRCPECGTAFRWPEVRKYVKHTWSLVMRLRHANQDTRMSLIYSVSGWLAIGMVHLLDSGILIAIVHFLAFLAGIMSLILGTQVFNMFRVPSWAREQLLRPPPSLLLGGVAVLFGASLTLGALVLWA